MRQRVNDYCEAWDEELILLEPAAFDAAILGITSRIDGLLAVAYDERLCVAILEGDGMTHEDAMEFFDFNTWGAGMGDHGPVFIDRLDDAAD